MSGPSTASPAPEHMQPLPATAEEAHINSTYAHAQVMPAFLRLLGLQDLGVAAGEAGVCLVFDPKRHSNGLGVAHGGLICTLLDVVMGYAAATHRGQWRPVLTVGQTVQFVGTATGRLRAQGRVTGGGRSIVHCSAEVRDEQGELLASGVGTFKRLKSVPPTADGLAEQKGAND